MCIFSVHICYALLNFYDSECIVAVFNVLSCLRTTPCILIALAKSIVYHRVCSFFRAIFGYSLLFRLGADDGRAMPTGVLFSSTFALNRGYK